jgi:hypothetical protein
MDLINQRQFIDSPESGVRSIIRRMMKVIICEEMCNRMNTTGRSSKLSASCDGSSVKAIKTPESIMRFIAKYAGILTSLNEEDAYVEVKKVITRWISDERNNKFLRRNRRMKQRFERQMMSMSGPPLEQIMTEHPSTSYRPHLQHLTHTPMSMRSASQSRSKRTHDPLNLHM